MRYRVDASRVVHERLDDELTIIDLATGTYFGVLGAGIDLWEALAGGATADEAAGWLTAAYEVEPADASSASASFTAQLLAAELLAPYPDQEVAPAVPVAPVRRPWAPPVLETYTDMEDFLRLDPIHEVDPEQGWPRPAQG